MLGRFRYQSIRNGLVGHWRPSRGPTGNTLYDSVRGNHGALTNVTWSTSGSGLSLGFNGTNSTVSTNFLGASALQIGNISWSIWIYPRLMNVFQSVFSSYVGDAQVMELFVDNTGSRIGAGNYVGSPSWAVIGSVSANQWFHVAFNRFGTNNTLFINGVQVASATSTNAGNNVGMFLGSRNGASNFYNGLIDDFAYYYRNLTASEILTIYTAGRGALDQRIIVPVFRGYTSASSVNRNNNQLVGSAF